MYNSGNCDLFIDMIVFMVFANPFCSFPFINSLNRGSLSQKVQLKIIQNADNDRRTNKLE